MDFRNHMRAIGKNGRTELAPLLNTTQNYLSTLAYSKKHPALGLVALAERVTGGDITRQETFPELLGDLVNISSLRPADLFPEFEITCRSKVPSGEPVPDNVLVHSAGAAVYLDTPAGEKLAFSAEEASLLAQALHQAISAHIIARQASDHALSVLVPADSAAAVG